MAKTGSGDLYDTLGVPKDASPEDIKKAFRKRARECHPDVAGPDAAKAEEFKRLREAYEVLSDPVQRARYDRRGQPRTSPYFGSHWNRGTVNVGAPPPTGARTAGNDLDLEDIFNDFGVGDFGFTGQTRGQPGARPNAGPTARSTPRPSPGPSASGSSARAKSTAEWLDEVAAGAKSGPRHPSGRPPGGSARVTPDASASPRAGRATAQPGRDIPLAVDVPWDVAARGGTVTLTYQRLRRADDGRTLYRYDELYDLKVPPGTRHGDTLRVANMGDAGLEGGPSGELVVDVRVVGTRGKEADHRGSAWDPEVEGRAAGAEAPSPAPEPDPRRDPGRMRMPGRDEPAADGTVRVDIGIVEALLGGRVSVVTPTGTVRVSIPPGTSSGTRMRLRGRGPAAADGSPTDLYAELRIVVPKELDEESRRLIERFAELNPTQE